jgi:nucleotide-binding universal stress UspA family protein
MFKKVIWATDGSDNADRALELAKSVVSGDGASLLVLHSVEHLVGPGSRGAPAELLDEDDRTGKLAQQVEELTAAGINAELRVVQGGATGAAHTVARVAEEEGADLIVIGTRGHTPLAGVLLGSVAQRLVSISPCPVLVVPKPAS